MYIELPSHSLLKESKKKKKKKLPQGGSVFGNSRGPPSLCSLVRNFGMWCSGEFRGEQRDGGGGVRVGGNLGESRKMVREKTTRLGSTGSQGVLK